MKVLHRTLGLLFSFSLVLVLAGAGCNSNKNLPENNVIDTSKVDPVLLEENEPTPSVPVKANDSNQMGHEEETPEHDAMEEEEEAAHLEEEAMEEKMGEVMEETIVAPAVKSFNVTAKQWEFVPAVITVEQGDIVNLLVNSVDVDHGIAISAFGVNEQLAPGTVTAIEFVADKKGTFSMFCNVFCGSGHGSMKATLIVQ